MRRPRATIINYEMGNLGSVENALKSLGVEICITQSAQSIEAADFIVLPGQGAFWNAMEQLNRLHLTDPIKDYVRSDRPFLGICLGLQLLFEASEESPLPGLGIFPGTVKRFTPSNANVKVPHMGWNTLKITQETSFLKALPDEPFVYFIHSYYVAPQDNSLVSSETILEAPFVSSIAKGNLFASQFHPEKSGGVGIRILTNFIEQVKLNAI